MFKILSVEEISNFLKLPFIGKNKIIKGVQTLKNACEEHVTFFSNPKYINDVKLTKAGACLIKEQDQNLLPSEVTRIITGDPYLSYGLLLDLIVRNEKQPEIAPTAYISNSAKIGSNCSIGHNSVIEDEVIIGNNVEVGPNVTLANCTIGDNCIIHTGVRIGQDGFGFTMGSDGNIKKIKQIGRVIIGNNVEIGANSTVDRGAIENTIIGNYTKIDNLVQIGHNVVIGKNCIICAQVGIAGSTVIGDYVMIGGQAGINGHITIGSQVQIAAQSGVASNVKDREKVGGYPAVTITDWHRQSVFLKNAIKK
jgi:UDP-3-O-[3-hydroxymyristoyl] glucosamine N-acyltransferase